MQHQPFVIERTYNAPVARVWTALTDKAQMKQWYFDIPDFKAEKGAEFSFTGDCEGVIFVHRCTMLDVVMNKKLQYTWRYEGYEGDSTVTIELFDEDGKTRVRLTHEGLETFPQDVQAFARGNFEAGWNEIMGTLLPKFVEQA